MYVDIESILNCLDDKKYEFIAKCQTDTENYVTSLGRESLAIQEVGGRTHYAAPDDYLKVLWKFKNGKQYHGYRLESVLSGPLSDRVVRNYNDFLENHRPDIEAQLKEQVMRSVNITSALREVLYDELQKRGIKHIRHQAVDAFIHGCHATFHSQLGQTAGTTVTHLVGTTVGTTVGVSIAHALSVAIVHALAHPIGQVVHAVALKAVFKTVVGHSVGSLVTAVLMKLIAAKMTAATASAGLGPLVWVAGGAYLFYKIATIPETLGEKLGEALADLMRGEFRPWTEKALEACFEKLADPEELLKGVVKQEIDRFLPRVLNEVIDAPSNSSNYEDVQKDVKKLVGYGEKAAKSWKETNSFPSGQVGFSSRNPSDHEDAQKNMGRYDEKAAIRRKEMGKIFAPKNPSACENVQKEVKRLVDYSEMAAPAATCQRSPSGAWSEDFDPLSRPQTNLGKIVIGRKKAEYRWACSNGLTVVVHVLLFCFYIVIFILLDKL